MKIDKDFSVALDRFVATNWSCIPDKVAGVFKNELIEFLTKYSKKQKLA